MTGQEGRRLEPDGCVAGKRIMLMLNIVKLNDLCVLLNFM